MQALWASWLTLGLCCLTWQGGAAKVTQCDVLRMCGVPEEEIPKFKDATHWLQYFPPLGKRDLKNMG